MASECMLMASECMLMASDGLPHQVRNSWSDGLGLAHASKGRGSHSYLYYMRAISDGDESLVCPNPHSPRSWPTCDELDKCLGDGVAIAGARAFGGVRLLECMLMASDCLPHQVRAHLGV